MATVDELLDELLSSDEEVRWLMNVVLLPEHVQERLNCPVLLQETDIPQQRPAAPGDSESVSRPA